MENILQKAHDHLNPPLENHQVDPPLHAVGPLFSDVFFAPLVEILQTAGITRDCPLLDDIAFACLCVQRALQDSKTGRAFLQTHAMPLIPELKRGNYFASLSSKRRLSMMRHLARELRLRYLPGLRKHDDLLAVFPELDGWEVWGADGHSISHATHDDPNAKGQFRPVGAIYRLDLRTGFAEFVELSRPTDNGNEHELVTLKRQPPESLRCGAGKGKHTLLVYDRAVIDFLYAYNLKQSKSVYVLTRWKESLRPLSVIPRPVDRNLAQACMIVSDETLYFNNTPGTWRKITVKSPDSAEVFVVLTNEMTLAPWVLCETFRLRWRIEKTFNQQEQKLDERKAWAKSDTSKTIQGIAICLGHNLLQLLKAKLKTEEGIEDTKVITSYRKDLDRRETLAQKAGRYFPKAHLLALYRPTEVSLQFIRWMRSHLQIRTCYRLAVGLLRPLMVAYL